MKKTIILLTAVLACMAGRAADEVTVTDTTVPQGAQVMVGISLNNPEKSYTAGQMLLTLPDGVTAVLNGNGDPTTAKGERMAQTNHAIGATHLDDGTDQFTIFSISSEAIPDTEGTLFYVTVTADESLPVGTVLEGRLEGIEMTTTDATPTPFNNQTFTITIGENRLTLDETSATQPEAASGVNVRVRRTIKAGEWSTICLPFAMTEAQMQAAFGSDVQLADFTGYEATEDEDGNIVGIAVNFSDVDISEGMEANHPYLIKVSAAVSEFTADGVDIDPEEEPTVAAVKRTRKQWSEMIGNYVAGNVLEANTLFLNGNQFWYSAGKTKIKAYRAYFDFYDVLTEVEEAAAKVRFVIDGTPTAIEGITAGGYNQDGVVYDLSGRRLSVSSASSVLPKGMYIVNGKKVIVK